MKNNNSILKKVTVFILFGLIFQLSTLFGQTITMQGNAFKIGQTNHAGIKVILKRTVPSAYNDTIYTDALGHYSKVVPFGVYNIKFYQDSFPFPTDYQYQRSCYSNQTINNVNMYPVDGTIPAGNYYPGTNLIIKTNDTLAIQGGVSVLFVDNATITCYGSIQANGNSIDSVTFKTYNGINISSSITWAISCLKSSSFNYCNFRNISEFINTFNYNAFYFYFNNCNFTGNSVLNSNTGDMYVDVDSCIFVNSTTLNAYTNYNIIKNSKFSQLDCRGNCKIYNSIIDNLLVGDKCDLFYSQVLISISQYSQGRINIYRCDFWNIPISLGNINFVSTFNNCNINSCALTSHSVFKECSIISSVISGTSPNSASNCIFFNNSGTAIIRNGGTCTNSCFFSNDNNYSGTDIYIADFIGVNLNGDSIDVYGNIFVDPLLADTTNNNCHLLIGSPCIDAGDNFLVVDSMDLDGNLRVVDGNGDGQYIVDIGPYEFTAPLAPTNDISAISWLSPNNAQGFYSSTETVQVQIKNMGNVTGRNFTVSYSLNNGVTWVTQTFTDSIQSFQTKTFTFTQTANLSVTGNYQCRFAVSLLGDENTTNDTITKTLISNPYITIQGHVFIQGQTDHSNIRVILKKTSPSNSLDTVYTNSSGYYFKQLQQGVYTTYFMKLCGSIPDTLYNVTCFNQINTLSNVTLVSTLSGNISGTLAAGIYYVGCDINIPSGQTLIIQPGTELLFFNNAEFYIYGTMHANGNAVDSIIFDKLPGSIWSGLFFKNTNTSNQLSYCRVSNSSGGGIALYNATLSANNSVLNGNSGGCNPPILNCYSGAIDALDASMQFNHCNFYNNWGSTMRGVIGLQGGGQDKIFESCNFYNNNSPSHSGVFWIRSNNTFIRDCIFENNNFGNGGIILSTNNCTLINSKIINNSNNALGSFGVDGFIGTLDNVVIANNSGYALWSYSGSSVTMRNVLLHNNAMGVFNHTQSSLNVNIANSIIANNGSSVFNLTGIDETIVTNNCSFYNNGSLGINYPSNIGIITSLNNNGDNIDIYGNIFIDPMLADATSGNYHLATGSPCIDAGNNLYVTTTTDLEGNQRVVDGNGDSQTFIDMGPYEYNSLFYELHNLGVTEWNHPLSACNLGTEQVTIRVRNYGTMPETGFTLSYSLNNGITWHNETYSGTLAPGYTMTYNFTTTANFSANGTYQCCAKVHLTGDSQASNDSLFHSVSKQSTLLVNAQQYLAVNCYGGTGSVVAHTTGGNIPYSYLWNNIPTSTDSIVNGIYAGILTNVTVTDNLGCTGNASVTLTQPELLQIDISTHAANCNQNNGWAEATVIGGTGPYNFLWSNGDSLITADTLSSGTYSLLVTDDNGCAKTVYFVINNTGGFTLTGSAQDAQCYNGSDGTIDLTVSGGTSPYIYEWSNGATTQDLNGLVAGTYDVFVTDGIGCMGTTSFEVQNGSEITFTSANTNPLCSQNNGSIIISPNGGNSPYTYHWSGGQTSNTLSGVGAGNYIVTIYDSNLCVKIAQISLNNTNAPIINISSVQSAPCGGGGAAFISVTGGTTPYAYHWSNNYFGQNLVGFAPGQYVVTVTEQTGCIAVMQVEIPTESLPVQPICVVTVDSIVSRNKVVWEKVSSTGVDYYKIYRESSVPNQYLLVDTVAYASMSEFVDLTANPFIRSWRYKISQVDLCGNESPLSDLHKTIHLTINQGSGTSRNLIWDNYEGYYYTSFYIHRHTNALGWVTIDSLPNTLHSYTDTPPSQGGLRYVVSTKVPSPCMPTSISKAQGGPYSHAHSNMEDVAMVLNVMNNAVENEITIYPNPFSQSTTMSISNTQITNNNYTITIFDIAGKVVRTITNSSFHFERGEESIIIERGNLNAGIYFIELSNDSVYRGKLIVE